MVVPGLAQRAVVQAEVDAEVDRQADEQHRERDRDHVQVSDRERGKARSPGQADQQRSQRRDDLAHGPQRDRKDRRDQQERREARQPRLASHDRELLVLHRDLAGEAQRGAHRLDFGGDLVEPKQARSRRDEVRVEPLLGLKRDQAPGVGAGGRRGKERLEP